MSQVVGQKKEYAPLPFPEFRLGRREHSERGDLNLAGPTWNASFFCRKGRGRNASSSCSSVLRSRRDHQGDDNELGLLHEFVPSDQDGDSVLKERRTVRTSGKFTYIHRSIFTHSPREQGHPACNVRVPNTYAVLVPASKLCVASRSVRLLHALACHGEPSRTYVRTCGLWTDHADAAARARARRRIRCCSLLCHFSIDSEMGLSVDRRPGEQMRDWASRSA